MAFAHSENLPLMHSFELASQVTCSMNAEKSLFSWYVLSMPQAKASHFRGGYTHTLDGVFDLTASHE